MSTIDSHLNYGSQTIVNDVLRQLFPNAKVLDPSTSICVWIGRITMLVILGFGVWVMFQADSLIRIAVFITGMFASSAAFYWAQWWWWRVNLHGWVTAMIGGPLVFLGLRKLLPHWTWWQQQLEVSTSNSYAMDMLQAAISIALTTTLWLITTFLFPPEDKSTLCEFYRRARPLGAWGPIRQLVNEQDGRDPAEEYHNLFLSGIVIALLGTFWVASAILGLSQLTVGHYLNAGLLAVASGAGAAIFLPSFRWHIGRMEASQYRE